MIVEVVACGVFGVANHHEGLVICRLAGVRLEQAVMDLATPLVHLLPSLLHRVVAIEVERQEVGGVDPLGHLNKLPPEIRDVVFGPGEGGLAECKSIELGLMDVHGGFRGLGLAAEGTRGSCSD